MPVQWRQPGDGVSTIDLRKLEGNQIVIHFGGSLTSVDAYTFGNSSIAFADMVRSVNGVVNRSVVRIDRDVILIAKDRNRQIDRWQ